MEVLDGSHVVLLVRFENLVVTVDLYRQGYVTRVRTEPAELLYKTHTVYYHIVKTLVVLV